jgi:hypothetical protein
MNKLSSTRNQGVLALILIIGALAFGWVVGSATDVLVTATDFGGVLRQLAATWQVRTMLGAIGIDAVLGMIAALRVNTFSAARVGAYMRSNLVPYIFGYVLIAVMTYPTITALVYASIMASVIGSIIDNLIRLTQGTTPPSDAISNNLPPAEPYA